MSTNKGSITGIDDKLNVLSNSYRRGMIYSLNSMEEDAVTYEKLLDEMIEEDYISEQERENLRLEMDHVHLPKMDESGLIDYDRRTKTIRSIMGEDINQLLDSVQELEEDKDL